MVWKLEGLKIGGFGADLVVMIVLEWMVRMRFCLPVGRVLVENDRRNAMVEATYMGTLASVLVGLKRGLTRPMGCTPVVRGSRVAFLRDVYDGNVQLWQMCVRICRVTYVVVAKVWVNERSDIGMRFAWDEVSLHRKCKVEERATYR